MPQHVSQKDDWQEFRTRYIPCVLPIIAYWAWPASAYVRKPIGLGVNIWDKGHYKVFWKKKGIRAIATFAFKYLFRHRYTLHTVRADALRAGRAVVNVTRQFAARARRASVDEYVKFLEVFESLYGEFTKRSMLLWLFTSSTMEGKIREALMKYTEKEREEIFSIMSLPEETSYSQKEEKRFDALVARARRHGIGAPDVRRGIRVFARAYFWFPWEYVGPTVWDERTVQARVRAALHVQTTHKRRNIRTEQDACVRRYALPKDVRVLFSILHAVTLMQDDRKMINAQVCYYLYHDIFSVLAKQFHVTQAHIQYLDIDLLQQYVQTGDRAALRDALKAREDFFVVLRDDTTRVVHYGKESKQYLKKIGIVLEVTQNATEVRGVTAHPGVVRGPVRIVHTSSDRKKFPEGSILVTGMTTPDFVPLMKRTAAIVTDEGGITSHAALVARELGKPCIVGTRNATRVFKDGDDVTVDANVGVVKKIT